MGYVNMPEMLSPEVVKALAGNVYTIKDEPNPKDEMAAAWKEYMKEDKECEKKEEKKCEKKEEKKCEKKEEKKYEPYTCWHDENDCCCPKKIKFLFILNNAVVINTNAVCEEEDYPA